MDINLLKDKMAVSKDIIIYISKKMKNYITSKIIIMSINKIK